MIIEYDEFLRFWCLLAIVCLLKFGFFPTNEKMPYIKSFSNILLFGGGL